MLTISISVNGLPSTVETTARDMKSSGTTLPSRLGSGWSIPAARSIARRASIISMQWA